MFAFWEQFLLKYRSNSHFISFIYFYLTVKSNSQFLLLFIATLPTDFRELALSLLSCKRLSPGYLAHVSRTLHLTGVLIGSLDYQCDNV